MHKSYRAQLIVALLILLFSSFPGTILAQVTPADSSTADIEITDPFRHIVFLVPSNDWDVRVEDLMGTSLSRTDEATLSSIRVVDSYLEGNTSLEDVWQGKLSYLKKNKPGYVYYKERDDLMIDNTKAIGITYKDPADQSIVRLIFFKTQNKYRELTFDIGSEAIFQKIKPQLAFILKNIRIPSSPISNLAISDPYLGITMSVPGNKEWGFETASPYKRFYYIPAGQYSTRGKINLFHSIYSVNSAQSANEEWNALVLKNLPGVEFLIKGQSFAHKGIEMYSSTFKNPVAKTVVRGLNFIHRNSSLMIEFIIEEDFFDQVKSDFSTIMKNIVIVP
ncbi:MAG: hypothetical protein ACD_62C00386G0003 [uncultured bacterium]|nr:MAG: hypothetical protein ACD_62C00386G0003 [uncultured bacterium]HLD44018.1 hypothetical protein [bacterium]